MIEELDDYDLQLIDIVPDIDGRAVQSTIDICDFAGLHNALADCHAVIHLAVAAGAASDEETFRTNVLGTWNVLAVSQLLGVSKVIIMSSEAALGLEYLDRDPPPLYVPIDEAHPLRPSDTYGVSKQICEILGQQFSRRTPELSVVCLRPTEVLVGSVLDHILTVQEQEDRDGPIRCTRSSTNPQGLAISRAYVRGDDLARMIRAGLETDTEPFECFWASAADTYAAGPTLDTFAALYGQLPRVLQARPFEEHPRRTVFDIGSATRRLGWRPSADGWQAAVAHVRSAT